MHKLENKKANHLIYIIHLNSSTFIFHILFIFNFFRFVIAILIQIGFVQPVQIQIVNYSFIDLVFEDKMAESVRNNARTRRPPSHLRDDLVDDNFDPTNPHLRPRDIYRQTNDPYTLTLMARQLVKFLGSVNKKYNQLSIKKAEIEASVPTKKTGIENSKNSLKNEKMQRDQRLGSTSKINANNLQAKSGISINQSFKGKSNLGIQITKLGQQKVSKSQTKPSNSSLVQSISSGNLQNIETMSKASRQQYLKTIHQSNQTNRLKTPSKPSLSSAPYPKNEGKVLQSSQKMSAVKSDPKLFKRCSYHIGIAYNIHIQNVKQKNPNFTPDDVDPTYISRKLKMDNIKQQQQAEKLRQQQEMLLRQKQQEAIKLATKYKNDSIEKKQPICIDIEDENEGEGLSKQKKQVGEPRIDAQIESIELIKIQSAKIETGDPEGNKNEEGRNCESERNTQRIEELGGQKHVKNEEKEQMVDQRERKLENNQKN